MHEPGAAGWGEVIAKHHSALQDELSARLDSEVRDVRRLYGESLNQALRRLRLINDEEQVLQILRASCETHAGQSVVLVFENNQARILATAAGRPSDPAFAIDSAPAILAVIESRDPVVAVGSADEISAVAAALASDERSQEDRKVYLFPVVARQSVVAMLVAAGAVDAAAIELLCGAAAMRLESIRSLASSQPVLPGAAAERRLWDDLSAEDQKIHLQAQRIARVRVAGMRVYQGDALRRGTDERNIYGALRSTIDAARQEFRQNFLSKSPTMVDYLHLEILRNLAQDDDRLLGPEYPGPMV